MLMLVCSLFDATPRDKFPEQADMSATRASRFTLALTPGGQPRSRSNWTAGTSDRKVTSALVLREAPRARVKRLNLSLTK